VADEVLEVEARMLDQVSPTINKMVGKAKGGFDKMTQSAQSFNRGVGNVVSKAVNLKNILLGFVGIKIFKSVIGDVQALGDGFDKMSFRLGVSTEFLQELDFAANLAGSSVQSMQTGIRRLSKSASDADRGLVTATEAFADVGVNVKDVNGQLKDAETLFGEVVTGLGNVESSTKRVALAQELLGRSGTELLPIVAAGADAFEDAKKQAHDLGVVMSKDALKASVDYTDAMFRLNSTFKGLKIKFIIPILRQVADTIEEFIANGGFEQWTTQIKILASVGKSMLIVFGTAKLMGIATGFKAVGTAAEIAAIKAGRMQAVMNGLKFAGFMIVITGIQIAIDKVLGDMEKLNETKSNVDWTNDEKQLERLIQQRQEYDKQNKIILEQRALLKGSNYLRIEGVVAVEKAISEAEKVQKNINKSLESEIGYTFENATNMLRSEMSLENQLELVQQINKHKSENPDPIAPPPPPNAPGGLTTDELKAQREKEAQDVADFIAMQDENTLSMKKDANDKLLSEAKRLKDEELKIISDKNKQEKAERETANNDRIALQKQQNDTLAQGKRVLTDAIISQSARGLQALASNEKEAQRIAFVASLIQGSLAVQRALAVPPGFPFTLPSALSVGLMAAGNSASIASQAFEAGGFPQGRNALIRVNESGQEAVLNAGATSALGRDNINRLNNGGNTSTINKTIYSPTINVGSGSKSDVIDALEQDKPRFAKYMTDLQKRNYL